MSDQTMIDIRLADLRSGPWMEEARIANELLKPPARVSRAVADGRSLATLMASAKEKPAAAKIARILRPHWVGNGISNPNEIAARESLDAALTYPQLLELAVETGYLSIDDVREEARNVLTKLLWSPAARKYLDDYDYITVRFLAERVNVDLGLPRVTPPLPNDKAAVRFATFLSVLSIWEEDDDLDTFLGWLDGYNETDFDDPDAAFRAYLKSGKLPASPQNAAYFVRLTAGLRLFISLLGRFFSPLDRKDAATFGTFFSYWLAKFFGFDRGATGYVPKSYDLSKHVRGNALLDESIEMGEGALDHERSEGPSAQYLVAARLAITEDIVEDVNAIRRAWDATRDLLDAQTSGRQSRRAQSQR